jgi:prophage tail gpP-like protein
MADGAGLLVNGKAYGGWTSVRVTRGIEAIAGSFDLTVSERWDGQAEPWPIVEEDTCVVTLGDALETPVITGYVDIRSQGFEPGGRTFNVSGRDKTGALVDCSAVLGKYEFKKIGVLEFCELLAKPFEIGVSLQPGAEDKAISTTGKADGGGTPSAVGTAGKSSSMKLSSPIARLVINPGDSVFEVIDRACRMAGLLPVSDGAGGIVLTRTGGARATSVLAQGENILTADVNYDATKRYRRYMVAGQTPGSDELVGQTAANVSAHAEDLQVRRASRVLLVRPDGAVTLEFAKARAAWEASVRAARSATVTVTVQGWTQRDGSMWPINALARVHIPALGITYTDLLITEATYSLQLSGGTTTTLSLTRADAFRPEPTIEPSRSESSAPAWLGN